MNLDTLPQYLHWIQYLSLFRLGYANLAITELHGLKFEIAPFLHLSGEEYLKQQGRFVLSTASTTRRLTVSLTRRFSQSLMMNVTRFYSFSSNKRLPSRRPSLQSRSALARNGNLFRFRVFRVGPAEEGVTGRRSSSSNDRSINQFIPIQVLVQREGERETYTQDTCALLFNQTMHLVYCTVHSSPHHPRTEQYPSFTHSTSPSPSCPCP